MRALFSIFLCLLAFTGVGQEANYQLADRFTDARLRELLKTTKVEPTFLEDGERFWYRYETGGGVRYYFVDPKRKLHRELFNRDYVAGEISTVTGEAVNAKTLKLNPLFDEEGERFIFMVGKWKFRYDMKTERRTAPTLKIAKGTKMCSQK